MFPNTLLIVNLTVWKKVGNVIRWRFEKKNTFGINFQLMMDAIQSHAIDLLSGRAVIFDDKNLFFSLKDSDEYLEILENKNEKMEDRENDAC